MYQICVQKYIYIAQFKVFAVIMSIPQITFLSIFHNFV